MMTNTMAVESEMKTYVFNKDDKSREHVEAHNLDTLLKNLGYCGRFQVVFVMLGYFPLLPAAWGMMFMAFGNYNPGWKCHDQETFNLSDSFGHPKNEMSFPRNETNFGGQVTSQSMCASIRSCNNLTFNDIAATIVSEWTLVCDDADIPSFIICIEMVGVMLGSYTGGQIGDKFGRKFSIHGGAALLVLTNIIAIFSVSWKMYTTVRFFIGLACGGILSSAAVYMFEFIQAEWRASLGTFPFWNISTVTFSLCVMALKNWRHVHIVSALIAFVAFLPVFWLPESMRFLTVHGKLERANKVVRNIARLNRRPIPDTTILNVVAEKEKQDMKNKSSYTYCDLFRRNIRQSSLIFGMTWFILSIGYTMIGFGIKSLSGDFFVNLLLFSALPAPMRIVSLAIVTKVGRKLASSLFVFLACLCSCSVVVIQLVATGGSKDVATLVMALGTNAMVEAAWGAVVVFGVEQMPTGVRNLFYGYCVGLARLGSVVSPFLIPKETLPIYGAFLALGVLLLACFIGLLTLSETIARPLQDNLKATTVADENYEVSSHR